MKNLVSSFCLFTLCGILFFACDKPDSKFNTGVWRGALITESGAEIPFNFDVKDSLGKLSLAIMNSSERFKVDEITRNGDSIHIQMPLFDSEINGVLSDGKINGVWTKHLADKDANMTFYAQAEADWRIKQQAAQPTTNVSGRWSATFISGDGVDTTVAVGEFVQNKSKVTGTFLTPTGDYRFLEGIVEGNQLSLSTFDGSHAFLFTVSIEGDSVMTNGKFYSGFSSIDSFKGKKDDQAKLPDAYGLMFLKDGTKKIDFSFPDLEHKTVSLDDAKFKNKVVVVQMLGSWCPNCMDETSFLTKFYNQNKEKGVEVIGLAYERTRDFEKSKKNIERLKNRFDIKYPLLITGYTDVKSDAAKSLPMLNKVIAFPTMIVIDKKGNVRKIHTGFSGPGTGNHYEEFVNEFDKLINDLLAE
ncbi:MAG: TlpA family protein disulfide reductase [Bacteroidetes bacterium]|nr:TlpA family protein disulfide reductase [Bacteroidota bacterium]MBU1371876.1 TlpA family protein disulfide reductase [Bacteroidota bacterium]MBU1483239.1 TlpA family protein disulfide reductase [Bacteroidota bacterium]MBU1759408.1 TlpA family protein disulfide reductase [Bacteroidota bacterium]MBU2268821.1 TlpA family protein disulfide reductase [Bacteroidota bacterium]